MTTQKPESVTEQRAGAPRLRRSFEGAIVNRLTHGWVTSSTSADAEIDGSLIKLRDRSRQLRRDSPYVRQAIRAIGKCRWPRHQDAVPCDDAARRASQ